MESAMSSTCERRIKKNQSPSALTDIPKEVTAAHVAARTCFFFAIYEFSFRLLFEKFTPNEPWRVPPRELSENRILVSSFEDKEKKRICVRLT